MSAASRPTALITGASSGIGKALASEFAKHGYDVVITARNASSLQALAESLQTQYKITATAIAADLQNAAAPMQLHADVKARGLVISALANNAGCGVFAQFHRSDLPSDLAMMQLNMNAVVALSKLFMPDLLQTKGKIINTASTAAFQPGPNMAVYFATKAFVLSFSEAIAAELSGTGVTVTAFCPGPTASGFQDAAHMGHSALVKGKTLPSSEEVAALGFKAMQRGQRVYIPGVMNWLLAQSPRITPRNLLTLVAKFLTRPT
jgi:uncharacterized protein